MKSKLKQLLFAMASIVLVYSLSACSSNGYSLDDVYVSIATVHADAEGRAVSFTLDNGETLFVAATNSNHKPKYERAVISYTILGENYERYDYAIRLNQYIADVLTKPIAYVDADDEEGQNELGYNNLKVFSIRAKADYITVEFGYNMAGKDAHLINLVALSPDKEQQGTDPIKLQLRHNINNDEEHYASKKLYASFKLDDYVVANMGNQELAFEVEWTEYDGTVKKEVLKYPL